MLFVVSVVSVIVQYSFIFLIYSLMRAVLLMLYGLHMWHHIC